NITATYGTLATSASPVGPYDITATLVDPNAKLGNYTKTLTNGVLTITQAATGAVVTTSSNPSVFPLPITFTATVSSANVTPTGTITFKDGIATLGTATLNSAGVATF